MIHAMSTDRQRVLVTAALPYANGPIHFGHIAGNNLPADVFARFQRLKGADVLAICGTDEHGVAITIAAKRENTTPQAIVDHYHGVIARILERMDIRYDNFSRTSRPINHEMAQRFFTDLLEGGFIEEKVEKQLYSVADGMFLADRYVLGTCPKCGHENARGDECPKCGAWLDPLTLIEPRSALSGDRPEVRETKNWYLRLQDFQPKLEAWIGAKDGWKENVLRFVQAMFKEGLRERAITRDLEWGVKVPVDGADGKVLYVWFDAPIGYISASIEWAEAQGTPERWRDYWQSDDTRLVHFLGKDNIPFHCIVFPAMLMGQKEHYVLPDNVPANEFYNLEGRKLNTTAGWYIDVEGFLDKYPVDTLRYTLVATLPELRDTEFSWRDYQMRVNAELADTFGNLVTRVLKFAVSYFDGKVPEAGAFDASDEALLADVRACADEVAACYDGYTFRAGLERAMALAHTTNRYFNEKAPWKSRKTDIVQCATTIHVCIQAIRQLALLFHPIMPQTTERLVGMLGIDTPLGAVGWDAWAEASLPAGHVLGEPAGLFTKIDDDVIATEVAALEAPAATKTKGAPMDAENNDTTYEAPAIRETVSFDDFMKLDLRVGRVVAAEELAKSKKLLKLEIDLGVEKRQILAGMKGHYTPEQLVGTNVVVLANLAPRKMVGEESQGMVLAADAIDGAPLILRIDGEPPTGTTVH